METRERAASLDPRALIQATRPFAREFRWRSWWFLTNTLASILGMLVIATIAPWWPARLAASLVGSMMLVRGFIMFHDWMHGAILRGSPLGGFLMWSFGLLLLVPARSWKASHNYHHAHVGQIEESHVGSFPVMEVEEWRRAKWGRRLFYRIARSPLNLIFAYFTVFLFSITLEPLLRSPRRHWDSALALLVHGGVIFTTWFFGGFWASFYAVILPFFLASMVGGYLFYAQHNYPGVRLFDRAHWSFHRAALESCSYIRLGRIMRWFTGDIGFHHVHHLNSTIPFYRLEEAMRSIPSCQDPVVTTLWPWDVLACLRLKLWDRSLGRMVSFREARTP